MLSLSSLCGKKGSHDLGHCLIVVVDQDGGAQSVAPKPVHPNLPKERRRREVVHDRQQYCRIFHSSNLDSPLEVIQPSHARGCLVRRTRAPLGGKGVVELLRAILVRGRVLDVMLHGQV